MTASKYREAERAVIRAALDARHAIHAAYHEIQSALNDDRVNPGAVERLENEAEALAMLDQAITALLAVNRWPVGSSSPAVGRDASDTSQDAAQRVALTHGSLRETVFQSISWRERGMTDRELELLTGRSHESVSSARNSLVNDGWLYDSGERRDKRIVWKVRP